MLLGRSTELNYLNNYYQKDGSQLLVLYGQKNIGKTTLLSEFVKDKPYTYYQARACSEREQKFQWARELELNGTKLQSFPSYQQIFSSMVKEPTYKKVIIIDEFQYIVKSSGDFFNEIVAFSRNDWGSQQTLVVLCSSSIGWIENSMVTRIGTAAYEINGFLKVKELDFLDLVRRYPKFDTEQCINAYAILGGVPGLWKYFNTSFSIKENIEKYVLKKGCYLYEEGSRYVSEELRETSVYYAILATLASGKHKLNDLYQHTGFSRAKISVYLKNLMELEIVEKVFSFDTAGKDNTQKGIYRICNHYVAFWFKYLYPHMSDLNLLTEEEFYERYIATDLKGYVSGFFNKVCMEYMNLLNEENKLPFHFEKSGEWVGKTGTIDIVAQDEEGHTLVGVCNWDKAMFTYEDYEWLLFNVEKAKLTGDYIYLFTVGGFDEKMNLEAKVKKNIFLINLNQL